MLRSMFLLPKLLGILLLSVVARIGGAQDQPPIPPEISSVGQPAAELKPDDIEELKKRLEGVTDVSEDQKRTVQESIQRATDQLKMATDEKANKARFESQIATVEKDRQEKLTRLQSLKSE
ncbi:MAG: hypothetical protein KDA80_21085, partial [Planctomycetaceae bacterium]|nr:hypothetical protein [Planctomycetaceae bacterium]